MKNFISCKIHGIRVTDKSVKYRGSVGICRQLLVLAGIEPYEAVDVINLTTGARWTTYVIPEEAAGKFSLNGGGARLGELGDECVILTYQSSETFLGANVVFCDESNRSIDIIRYENS